MSRERFHFYSFFCHFLLVHGNYILRSKKDGLYPAIAYKLGALEGGNENGFRIAKRGVNYLSKPY